jgi:hypothetical protein
MDDALSDLAAWAWARHHNEWSWYIRPILLLPYCWFAWRRSLAGIVVALLALVTSMAWFPAPAAPSPMAIELLAAEKAYLLAPWSAAKLAVALLIPLSFAGLALAFWHRSLGWGLVVINAMVAAKVGWTLVAFTPAGALYHLVPALAGVIACNVVVLAAWAWLRRRRSSIG